MNLQICNKKFAQSGDRNIHMKRHQNLKPHICTFCKKPFRLLKALRAHERIHTGRIYINLMLHLDFKCMNSLSIFQAKKYIGVNFVRRPL